MSGVASFTNLAPTCMSPQTSSQTYVSTANLLPMKEGHRISFLYLSSIFYFVFLKYTQWCLGLFPTSVFRESSWQCSGDLLHCWELNWIWPQTRPEPKAPFCLSGPRVITLFIHLPKVTWPQHFDWSYFGLVWFWATPGGT